MSRTRGRWFRPLLTVAIACAGLAVLPAAAHAAVTDVPTLPRNIVAFPERDFVVLEGYPAGIPVRVDVVRNSVVIGTARVTTAASDPSAEINHPGGYCWEGVTPDIRAGDVVRAVGSTDPTTGELSGEGSHVIDVAAEAAIIEGPDVVVHGTAHDAAGNPLPLALLEQRIINGDFVDLPEIGRRDIRATSDGAGQGSIAYDAPGSVHWTARYAGLSAKAQQLAVQGQTRIMSWLETAPNGDRAGLTIFEQGESNGPGMAECPPSAEYAVTATHPRTVNAANVGTVDLVVDGRSYAARFVAVSVSDGTHPPLTAEALPTGTFQAWTVTIPAADVATLDDGLLQVRATYSLAEGTITGRDLVLRKDVVAPRDAPQASPPGGPYEDPQQVTLDAEPGASIHYTLDGSAPDDRDPVYAGQLRISADATLRAVAYDLAGNPSPVLTTEYFIGSRLGDAATPGPATPDPAPSPGAVSQPPRIPQNVVAFPERDFVVAEGYPADAPLTFEVLRNGSVVGTATGMSSGRDPSLEVNHPGGVCWTGSTPDLQAGDVVRVLTDVRPGRESGDATTILGIKATAAEPGPAGGVVVHGTALEPDGTRFPLDRLEQRIINPDLTLTSHGRRDLRATSDGAGDGTLTWDDPLDPNNGHWTATFMVSGEVLDAALAGQTRIMGWQAVVGVERAGLTIFEVGEVGGPGMGGCPAAAVRAITSAVPAAVTASTATLGTDVVIHGVSDGQAPDSAALSDGTSVVTGTVSASADTRTWTARFDGAEVATLADGALTAMVSFAAGTASFTIPKDTVAPEPPMASPGSGRYRADQSVALSNPVEKSLPIYFTTDNSAASPDDARYRTLIPITSDTTLRAIAVDEAGNRSAESALVYEIRVGGPPMPTGLALDPVSDSGTSGDLLTNDRTPTFVGAADGTVTVDLFVDGAVAGSAAASGGSFAVTPSVALDDGSHEIRVRARDAGGRTSQQTPPLTVAIDATAPEVTLEAGPTGVSADTTPDFVFTSSEPAATECSPASLGTGWAACTSPTGYGPLPDGAYTFRVRATDPAGNVSVERSRSFTVDTTPVPAPTPVVTLPTSGQLPATTVPVRVTWPAASETDLLRYELAVGDGTAWTPADLTGPTATTANVPLAPSATAWRFRLVTVDSAGNTAESTSNPFVLSAAQETASTVSYSPAPTASRWRLATLAGSYGGSVRWDASANATSTYSFTGTGVQWVGSVGLDRGRADVFLDGVRVATAVETFAQSAQARRIMFSRSGLAAGAHTLQVRVTGTKLGKSKGTRVDVDAFVSLS